MSVKTVKRTARYNMPISVEAGELLRKLAAKSERLARSVVEELIHAAAKKAGIK